ncbi:MAG TPA: hypothetical protein VMX74_05670 [Pirellulales bacterium]|nr:hypothetical protein [Pirellulales bacterium]
MMLRLPLRLPLRIPISVFVAPFLVIWFVGCDQSAETFEDRTVRQQAQEFTEKWQEAEEESQSKAFSDKVDELDPPKTKILPGP